MNNREMLELAAKAAGWNINTRMQEKRDALTGGEIAGLWLEDGSTNWNPRDDSRQALELAVEIGLFSTTKQFLEFLAYPVCCRSRSLSPPSPSLRAACPIHAAASMLALTFCDARAVLQDQIAVSWAARRVMLLPSPSGFTS